MSTFKTLLYLAILIYAQPIFAQEKYAVSNIPLHLLKNANAVIRDHDTKIDIISIDEISVHKSYTITILNKNANEQAVFTQCHNKFLVINKIKGTLYDDKGIEIRKIKNSDIKDNAVYGASFVDDNMYKEYDFQYSNYPFTVSYDIELKYKTLFLLDEWIPQDDYGISIERASIQVNNPSNISIKFKPYHIAQAPENAATSGANTLNLSLKEIPAVKEDELKPFELFPYPSIVFSADTFIFGDITGSMTSWSSFGKYYYDLNKNRNVLPEKTKQHVHQLTDTCTSDYSKISVLYQYLKNTTRYVSIQLGIGGWQTFEAAFVAEKGYGDCKALSNYMNALLTEAGIQSYPVLILAGRGMKAVLAKGLGYNRFNHVILCVPGAKDTTWIECTAKTLPAGYLSGFTENRDALMITPAGGIVVHTPAYTIQHNTIRRKALIYIDQTGMMEGNITSNFSGNEFDREYRNYYYQQTTEKIEKHLNEQFSLPSYHITSYKTEESVKKQIPQLSVKAAITGIANTQRSGKRTFFAPVIAPVTTYHTTTGNTRTTPFEIAHSLEVRDTTTCIFTGSAFDLESLPESTTLSYPFGSYSSKYMFENGNTIKCIRTFRQNEGVYAADDYIDYVKMMVEASSKDQQKTVVLLKKD